MLWNRKNLKTSAFRFRVDGEHFELSRTITLRWSRDYHDQVFLKHKITDNCCILKFLRLIVVEKLVQKIRT